MIASNQPAVPGVSWVKNATATATQTRSAAAVVESTRRGRVRLTPVALADEIANSLGLDPAYVSDKLLSPLASWLQTGADGRLAWKRRTLEGEVSK